MNESLIERITLLPYGGETVEEKRQSKEEEPNSYFESRCESEFLEVGEQMSKKGFSDDEVMACLNKLFRSVSDYYGN